MCRVEWDRAVVMHEEFMACSEAPEVDRGLRPPATQEIIRGMRVEFLARALLSCVEAPNDRRDDIS